MRTPSQVGRYSRSKGARFERAVASLLNRQRPHLPLPPEMAFQRTTQAAQRTRHDLSDIGLFDTAKGRWAALRWCIECRDREECPASMADFMAGKIKALHSWFKELEGEAVCCDRLLVVKVLGMAEPLVMIREPASCRNYRLLTTAHPMLFLPPEAPGKDPFLLLPLSALWALVERRLVCPPLL